MKKIIFLLLFLIACNTSFAAKESIYTKAAPEPIGVYSQAIKTGNTIYISGQIPINPETGNIVEGDFKNQVRQTLSNIKEIAKAAGGNLDDIVKLSVYLTDLNNFAYVNEVMLESFHLPYPARAVIEIKALPKNATVEIEAVMQVDNVTR
ncbi:MAG TPA: RidA family protein, partial [Gammaproteobacteria bacterium]|nr:RidA family protein [Gammaproteobacteria bacterium]